MSKWTRGERRNGLTYEQAAAMWRLAQAMVNLPGSRKWGKR